MSRDRHPAQRHLTVVQDAASTAAWWEAERAAARRDEAIARCFHTLAWCLVALTASACVVILVDGYRGLL